MKDYDKVIKDMDKVFKDMDKAFKEMDHAFKKVDSDVDKVFNQINDILGKVGQGPVARKIELGPWKPWFAWRPVTIKGKRIWMKKVYRRSVNTYVDMDDWTRYEYGDMFDILKDAK
jgi:hypothetical protein